MADGLFQIHQRPSSKLSGFQRKDAEAQRKEEKVLLRQPFQWLQNNDIAPPRRCYESPFISSLFFAALHLCVFALKILIQENPGGSR